MEAIILTGIAIGIGTSYLNSNIILAGIMVGVGVFLGLATTIHTIHMYYQELNNNLSKFEKYVSEKMNDESIHASTTLAQVDAVYLVVLEINKKL